MGLVKNTTQSHHHIVVVVVLTLTRIIKSVVTGQAPVTLELRNTPGKNTHNHIPALEPLRITNTIVVAVVVLILTRISRSVVTGQAPVTLEWENAPREKHKQTKGGSTRTCHSSINPCLRQEIYKNKGVHLRTCKAHTGTYVSILASGNRPYRMPPRKPKHCTNPTREKGMNDKEELPIVDQLLLSPTKNVPRNSNSR